MENFEFSVPTNLVFGKEAHKKIGSLVKEYGAKKVLLHYGSGSVKKSGVYDDVVKSLQDAGLEYCELGGVKPNPRLALVYEGIALAINEGVDFVLAVGGGSAIDSAKGIAVGALEETDIWDHYQYKKEVTKILPVGVILTIPAAGSETSTSSVVTDEANERKDSMEGQLLRPVLSIINPELFFTLPKNQIANGVADMMSHIFERYFTNTKSTDLTDALAEATLKVIMKNAPIAYENPQDYNAWAQLGHSGSMAHTGILGLGRSQEWSCHPIEHELSASYDVAHGAGLAAITPAWMEYVYKSNVPMFTQFAANVMGVEGSFRDPDAFILEGIRKLRAFFNSLGLPATLSQMGIGEDKLELMAKRATGEAFGKERPLGNIKPLYWQDVLNIFKMIK
ncbi:MAG: iron-containing alcohol dehydrogenase [Clostridiales bacterium]|jgi:alcohol dehydrogenase YqhD (iron-dependent ADH family)|nr:iron-containing alcohol dehydrogenase [Clostridiales bacterium]